MPQSCHLLQRHLSHQPGAEWKQDSTFQKPQHRLSCTVTSTSTCQLCDTSQTEFFHGAFQPELMESAAAPRRAEPQRLNSSKLLFQWDMWGTEKLSKEVQEVVSVTLTAKAMCQHTTAATAPTQESRGCLLHVPQLHQSKSTPKGGSVLWEPRINHCICLFVIQASLLFNWQRPYPKGALLVSPLV